MHRGIERAFELLVGILLLAAGLVFGSLFVGAVVERPLNWSLIYIVAAMFVGLMALVLRVFFPSLRRADGQWIGRPGAVLIAVQYIGWLVIVWRSGQKLGPLGVYWTIVTLVLVTAVLVGHRAPRSGTDA